MSKPDRIELPPITILPDSPKPAPKTYRPLGNRVIIRMDDPETKSPEGIELPNPLYRPTGVIVAVGPGYRDNNGNLIPCEVKVGDRVYLDGNQGNWLDFELKDADRRMFICREGNVGGVEEKE